MKIQMRPNRLEPKWPQGLLMGDVIVMNNDNECKRSPASLTKPRGRVTFTFIAYTILLLI